MNRQIITDFIVNLISRHPYFVAFFLCLFLTPFFYGSIEFMPPTTINLVVLFLLLLITIMGYSKYKNKELSFVAFVFFEAVEVFAVLYALNLYSNSEVRQLWLFNGICLFLFLLYFCADKSKYRFQITCLLVVGIGFALYLYYVLNVSINMMQHDVLNFNNFEKFFGGHAQYIEYIQKNYKLPDFDVSKVWQFAHPPLHHIICAIWLEFNEKLLHIHPIVSQESLQMLTLFYILCVIISSYKIFRYFNLTRIPLLVSLTITSFFPAFILLSGSINNDALSVAFIAGTIVCALHWKSDNTYMNISSIAFLFGLGMMTKISTATLAPALFFLFLATYFKSNDKNILLKQFAVFLIISLPLSLWFGIRNYVSNKVPFLFVHHMDSISSFKPQYIGNVNYFDRITDFSLKQLDSVYVQNMQLGCPKNDLNPAITLLKCSLFDEYINDRWFKNDPKFNNVSIILFYLNMIIFLISLFSMIYITRNNIKTNNFSIETIFMLCFFATMILGAYKHAYAIPYVAAMNFRYITPTVIISQLFFGLLIQHADFFKSKTKNIIGSSLAISFALCSTVLYVSIFLIN